jgi:hypothetical protein
MATHKCVQSEVIGVSLGGGMNISTYCRGCELERYAEWHEKCAIAKPESRHLAIAKKQRAIVATCSCGQFSESLDVGHDKDCAVSVN